MKYNPNLPEPTDSELSKLSEDEFFEWLDTKAEYLKNFTKPLDTYHLKKYASLEAESQGKQLSTNDIYKLNKMGKQNEEVGFDKELHSEWIEKKNDMLKKTGVKNVKTSRKQWFD